MKDTLAGLAVMVLAGSVWLQARNFPALPEGHPGPALFPNVVAAGLFLAGAALVMATFIRRRRSGDAPSTGAPATAEPTTAPTEPTAGPAEPTAAPPGAATTAPVPGLLRVALVVGAAGLYPVLAPAVGFVPTVSLVSVVVALLLRARPVPAVATAVVGAVVTYLLFTRLLGVPL